MNDPIFQTSFVAAATHADCHCNIWIITPADSDPAQVEAFLAYSSDDTVTWTGSTEPVSTVAQSLRATKAPSTLAPPTHVLEAIDRTGRSADVLMLSGFEGDAMAPDRARILTSLRDDWTADPEGHWAMRKRLEDAEPQQSK